MSNQKSDAVQISPRERYVRGQKYAKRDCHRIVLTKRPIRTLRQMNVVRIESLNSEIIGSGNEGLGDGKMGIFLPIFRL